MGWAAVEAPPCTSHGGLVGRDAELVGIACALGTSRLVTLTGAPGIGKTRLALALAADDPDTTVVVELASSADPSQIAAALASALAVQEVPGQDVLDTVVATIGHQRKLLIFDNCEHLLHACARVTARLLDGCPDLQVLATSREALGLEHELVHPVPPLAVPEKDATPGADAVLAYSSVALFVARAAHVQPDFRLNASVADRVAEICRRLDGVPLAIELAAARAAAMTVEEIARRLDTHLGLLNEKALGSASRHRTLAAALEWSHGLLSPREQAVLHCLSVFPGTFELEAASEICAHQTAGPRELSSVVDHLVSKSLVEADADPDHLGRYRLLATIRAFASERLEQSGWAAEVRTAHAAFYTALAERAEAEFTGPRQLDWFRRMETERANLRSALEWSLARGKGDCALRLAGALILFWRVRGPYSEGRAALQKALSTGPDQPYELRAKALWGAGFLALMCGDRPAAVRLLNQSLALYEELGDERGRARALLIRADAGRPHCIQCEAEQTAESVAQARIAGDHWCLAHALGVAAFKSARWERLDEARAMFEECLAVARAAGDLQGLRFGLIGLGQVALDQGDLELAESTLTEAVTVTAALSEAYDQATALTALADAAFQMGDYVRAHRRCKKALALFPHSAPFGVGLGTVELLAKVTHALGDPGRARALFDGLSSFEGTGTALGLGRLAVAEGDLVAARMRFDQALEIAHGGMLRRVGADALHELALLSRLEGDPTRAVLLHEEALSQQSDLRNLPAIARTLEAVAGLATTAGDHECAARLIGAAQAIRDEGGYARHPWESARYDADLVCLRRSLRTETLTGSLAAGAGQEIDHAIDDAVEFLRSARAVGGWASLTEREKEIAELVADGLNNPQIAERLVIAQETVKTHLSHIYGKLGVSGRTTLLQEAGKSGPTAEPRPLSCNLSSRLRTEADAYALLEGLRWPDGVPVCPHCSSARKHYFLTPKDGAARRTRTGGLSQRRVWKCADCRRQFSVLTGTILHGSQVPLRTWVLVVHAMTSNTDGISTREIECDHALTTRVASSVVHCIRRALKREPMAGLLSFGRAIQAGSRREFSPGSDQQTSRSRQPYDQPRRDTDLSSYLEETRHAIAHARAEAARA